MAAVVSIPESELLTRRTVDRLVVRALLYGLRYDVSEPAGDDLARLAGGSAVALRLALRRIQQEQLPRERSTAADRAVALIRLAISRT